MGPRAQQKSAGIATLKKAAEVQPEPSSWIWANSADAKQGINLSGSGLRAELGALTKMNGIIPSEW